MKRTRWLLALCFAAHGCILADFQKVADKGNSITTDGGAGNDGGQPGASADCNTCLDANCAEARTSCGADCETMSLPITPATSAPDDTLPFLACMRDQCEDSCKPTWGCVHNYKWVTPTDSFTINLQVADLISSTQRLPNVDVSACSSSDPGCITGSGLQATGTTDETGHTLLTVPRNFQGYFYLKGTDDSYAPSIGLWSQPTYWIANSRSQPMVSWAVADYLGAGVIATVDRSSSHLVFQVFNCMPLRLSGNSTVNSQADDVTITYSPPGKDTSRVFYTIMGNSIDTTRTSTSVSGGAFGGVFNLPSQSITVIGQHAGVEVGRAVIQLRAGAVGFLYLLPNSQL